MKISELSVGTSTNGTLSTSTEVEGPATVVIVVSELSFGMATAMGSRVGRGF